ncbi:MAG: S8 family serine peptidase, partial [Oscillospiraceae bacterium]|nr:S8 family serine peptidase [Oscillospiraceae bacterium]
MLLAALCVPSARASAAGACLNQWACEAIGLEAAGDAPLYPVRVALIDTGVTPAAVPGLPLAPGRNYVFPDGDTEDRIGHGTRLAGIIAGAARAESRVDGVAPGAVIVPLVYQSAHSGGVRQNAGTPALAQAIRDAVDVYGCRVINISAGQRRPDDALRDAVAHAEARGAIVVAAAGN